MASAGNDEAADGSSSGFIRFETDVSAITPEGIFSPEIEVLGIPWKIKAVKGKTSLGVTLYYRISNSSIWSIDVKSKLRLMANDKGNDRILQNEKMFNHDVKNWGYPTFLSWSDLIDDEKGYVKDDKIVIEAEFTLSNIVGLGVLPRMDFTDSNEPTHDIVLVINEEKIYVSKTVLAVHSPVFKAMFFGDFAEKSKKEIELKDVDLREFMVILNLIYPSYAKITDTNAEYLLKLADRFQIQTVINKVEQFLIDSSNFNALTKLNISDKYRLAKLQDKSLDMFKESKEILGLESSEDFKALSDKAKVCLLLKAMKLG